MRDLIDQTYTSRAVLAKQAGIPRSTFQHVLSDRFAERYAGQQDLALKVADALDERAAQFRRVADAMRKLASEHVE